MLTDPQIRLCRVAPVVGSASRRIADGPAHRYDFAEGPMVLDDDTHLLEGAPRLFGIVADPDDTDEPRVVAWGHELPGTAVVTWRLANGNSEVAIFTSADDALATAELLYTARLIWVDPTP
jgi:hypothetical protein